VPHLREGFLRLEAGQWRRAMDVQTLAEPESNLVARLGTMLDTDGHLKAEALTTVSGWPERKALLQAGGSPSKRTQEQQWITALEKALSGG